MVLKPAFAHSSLLVRQSRKREAHMKKRCNRFGATKHEAALGVVRKREVLFVSRLELPCNARRAGRLGALEYAGRRPFEGPSPQRDGRVKQRVVLSPQGQARARGKEYASTPWACSD